MRSRTEWVIKVIEGMGGRIGNAARTARLVKSICERQGGGRGRNARTVMQEVLGRCLRLYNRLHVDVDGDGSDYG
jgi:hypothetical protein